MSTTLLAVLMITWIMSSFIGAIIGGLFGLGYMRDREEKAAAKLEKITEGIRNRNINH